MNLALLFEPSRALPADPAPLRPGTLGARTAGYRVGAPFPAEWTTADVALLGVPEWRDDDPDAPRFDPAGPDAIRARFYALTPGTGPWRVVDLGNLRPGPTPADTAERLAEVVALLRRHGVLALILGGAHALTLGQHAGYEYAPDEAPEESNPAGEAPAFRRRPPVLPVRGAVIDRAFDVAETGGGHGTWLRTLLLREPSHLATLTHLASQRYHITGPEATALDKMYFDVRRLGALHADLRAAEPLLRAADWLSIDAAACAHAAIPGAPGAASPFGLSAEQLCQLTWYAGHARQLSSAGVYGYQPAHDPFALGAMTLATAAWYLIEGYYHRPAHAPTDAPEHYTRYDVPLAGSTETLIFYQHPQTAQWWLLVEPPAAPAHLLPCTEDDYLTAARGEVPACWVQALARS